QQRGDLLLTQPLAPAGQRRAVKRQFVPEHHFAAEILEIRVLYPPVAQRLVREVVHVFEDEQPGHQPRWQRRLSRPEATYRTEALRQKVPINLRREPHQWMAKVDDRLQRRAKQVVLTVVARLAHRSPSSESRRQRNHEPPKSGIPKRKKTAINIRLSCKIEYAFRLNHSDQSRTSEYFTDDKVLLKEIEMRRGFVELLRRQHRREYRHFGAQLHIHQRLD